MTDEELHHRCDKMASRRSRNTYAMMVATGFVQLILVGMWYEGVTNIRLWWILFPVMGFGIIALSRIVAEAHYVIAYVVYMEYPDLYGMCEEE